MKTIAVTIGLDSSGALMAEVEKVTTYDLGMFSEYKSCWADETREFVGWFVVL